MSVVKVKLNVANKYAYINTDRIEEIQLESHEGHTEDHYHLLMVSGAVVHVALDDPTITAMVNSANSAYTGS